jgi:hypothetical protein
MNEQSLAERKADKKATQAAEARAAATAARKKHEITAPDARPPTPTADLLQHLQQVPLWGRDPRRPCYCYPCDKECHALTNFEQHMQSHGHAAAMEVYRRGVEHGLMRLSLFTTEVLNAAYDAAADDVAQADERNIRKLYAASLSDMQLSTLQLRSFIDAHTRMRAVIRDRDLRGMLGQLIEAAREGATLEFAPVGARCDAEESEVEWVDGDDDYFNDDDDDDDE